MAIHIERSININAPPERVWAVMADIERWPEWTESILRVERVDGGPFRLGSEARLSLTRTSSVYRVTEHTEGRSFTWESHNLGMHTRASYVIDPEDDGSLVTLTLMIRGWPATLLSPGLLLVGRRKLRLEAEGLKRRCKAAP